MDLKIESEASECTGLVEGKVKCDRIAIEKIIEIDCRRVLLNDCLCSFNFVVVFFYIVFSSDCVSIFVSLASHFITIKSAMLQAKTKCVYVTSTIAWSRSLDLYTLIFSILFLSCLRLKRAGFGVS